MGANNKHYRSVSGEEPFPLAPPDKESSKKSGWGKQSIVLSLATGILFIAVIAAVFSTIGSAVVSYTHSPAATSAAAVSGTVGSTPKPTGLLDGDTKSATDPDTIPSEESIEDCGYTPEQARANGCVFDVMMQLWTPKECYDQTLSDRFLESGNWTWYADTTALKTLTLDEMRKGEHTEIYVAQNYHVTHCIYAWERLIRALRNQQPIITELISYDHVIHCRHKTLQRADGGATIRGVRAPTGYTRCAKYDTWKYFLPANEHSTVDK